MYNFWKPFFQYFKKLFPLAKTRRPALNPWPILPARTEARPRSRQCCASGGLKTCLLNRIKFKSACEALDRGARVGAEREGAEGRDGARELEPCPGALALTCGLRQLPSPPWASTYKPSSVKWANWPGGPQVPDFLTTGTFQERRGLPWAGLRVLPLEELRPGGQWGRDLRQRCVRSFGRLDSAFRCLWFCVSKRN